jgi:Na+/proline symporter
MVVILYFLFQVYTQTPLIGSPGRMFELLQEAAISMPVEGNEKGSFLTLKSNNALIFGVIQLCSGSGTVFLDQAYWQRAIASRPTTAVRAYLLGGLAWFAIPFGKSKLTFENPRDLLRTRFCYYTWFDCCSSHQ